MADVRLTATNPEDSSVVPVACDASGRLLLQELPAIDTIDGDLTVTGKGSFAAGKSIIGNDGSAQFAQGAVDIYANGTTEFTQDVTFGGSGSFAGGKVVVASDGSISSACRFIGNSVDSNVEINTSAGPYLLRGYNTDAGIDAFNIGLAGSASFAGSVVKINSNGSASFAGNKAGFTAEGYLWCTTRRGDTVILDATSNGLASWVEYTPTSRIDDLRDELNAIRGDAAEMPADTP